MATTDRISPPILTTGEAADYLRCCSKTITNLIARGKLKGVRVGKAVRIERAELERFVAEGGGR